ADAGTTVLPHPGPGERLPRPHRHRPPTGRVPPGRRLDRGPPVTGGMIDLDTRAPADAVAGRRGSLFRAEWQRLFARRFTWIMLAVVGVLLVVIAAGQAVTSTKPSQAQVATAQAELEKA